MVAAEANCCGTKVVAFYVGGVPEAIVYDMGEVVLPFEIDSFICAVDKCSNLKADNENILFANTQNSKERMLSEYVYLYQNNNWR